MREANSGAIPFSVPVLGRGLLESGLCFLSLFSFFVSSFSESIGLKEWMREVVGWEAEREEMSCEECGWRGGGMG